MKYWEIITDNLGKAGWSWGCVSAIDSNGRTIWIAAARRDDGKQFVVPADEKLTAPLWNLNLFAEMKSLGGQTGTAFSPSGPGERYNLSRFYRRIDLPIPLGLFRQDQFPVGGIEHLRVFVAKLGRHARRIMNRRQPI